MVFRFSFIAVASADISWEAWKAEYGKAYNSNDEDLAHRTVFEANMAKLPELRAANPYAQFGSNQFSDLTDDEMPTGWVEGEQQQLDEAHVPTGAVGESKDWSGVATTPIKNQGHCGSCWAFSATEQIESMLIVQHQQTKELAPQELVDCKGDRSQRNGCAGGFPIEAFKTIEALGGICAESDYSYEGKNGRCRYKADSAAVKVNSYKTVSSEPAMKQYLGSTAPLSICHQTGGWQSYKGGILTSCSSGGGHCTQVVGYGSENGQDYWKVRNSWASGWGEAGYIRMAYGKQICGIKAGYTVDVEPVSGSTVV